MQSFELVQPNTWVCAPSSWDRPQLWLSVAAGLGETKGNQPLPPAADPNIPGERALHVRAMPPQLWWSIALGELEERDWRRWHTLAIEVFNPRAQVVPFHVRVFDQPDGLANDNGFKLHTRLEPGVRSTVKLSLQDMHDLDLSHVYGMILFTASGDQDDDLYLLNIRLE